MKRSNFIFLSLLLFTAFSTSAQESGLKISKLDFSLGQDFDRINNLDYTYFTNQIPASPLSQVRNIDFENRDIEGGVCENPHFRIGVTLEHSKFKNFELKTNVVVMSNRVDAVTYDNYSNNYLDYENAEYINFYARQDEVALEAALNYKVPVFKFIHLYGGVGTNLGMSFNNSLCVDASPNIITNSINPGNVQQFIDDVAQNDFPYFECHETGNAFNQRAFVQFGGSITILKRVELSMMFREGLGLRAHQDAPTKGTRLSSTSLGISYIL